MLCCGHRKRAATACALSRGSGDPAETAQRGEPSHSGSVSTPYRFRSRSLCHWRGPVKIVGCLDVAVFPDFVRSRGANHDFIVREVEPERRAPWSSISRLPIVLTALRRCVAGGVPVLARTTSSAGKRLDSGRWPRSSSCIASTAAAPSRNLGWRVVVKGTRKCAPSRMFPKPATDIS